MSAQAPLTGLRDELSELESRWFNVMECLAERTGGGGDEGMDFKEAGKLTPTKARPATPPLLKEFRAAFREVNSWIDDAESRLREENDVTRLSLEVDRWKPKVDDLKDLADKLTGVFLECGSSEDSRDVARLAERWGDIVKQIEDKLVRRRGDVIVAIDDAEEEAKTAASRLSVTSPTTTTTTTTTQAIADLDEEVIDTLPEEAAASPTKSSRQSKSKKSVLSSEEEEVNGNEDDDGQHTVAGSSLLSSRESSPDLEVVTGTMILKSNSPTFIKETVSKIPKSGGKGLKSPPKSPPKTLPKPKWFTLPQSGDTSPSKVKVVSNTLPSPYKVAQKKEVAQLSSKEEEFLAKENSAIERILNEATSDLAEVKRKAGYSTPGRNSVNSDYHQRVVKDFEASVAAVVPKIDKAKQKVLQLDLEPDLRLRRDLLSMEAKVMEAEVATLMSRGDTLVLFTQRSDQELAGRLEAKVAQLDKAWKDLKSIVDERRSDAAKAEEDLADFQSRLEDLVAWIGDAHERCSSGAADNGEGAADLAREVEDKKVEVRQINDLASSIKSRQLSLGTNSMVLAIANAQWDKLVGRVRARREARALQGVGAANGEEGQVMPADAGEVLARIARMREAVSAVDGQLRTQILSGKTFENLSEQADALETCKSALETLRPTIKKTAKDLEVLTGSLSVEYLERIVALSERLRDEWQVINRKFSDRHTLWKESKSKHDSYHTKRLEMENWLERAEKILLQSSTQPSSRLCSQEHIQLERQVSEKNKEVTTLAVLGKEIMNQTGAQEHVEIQTQVDRLLKRWKFVLSQLATHRERMNREKYVNNVNYMNHWLDDNLAKVLSEVNPSDCDALTEALEAIGDYDKPLMEKQRQMDKLTSASLSSDVMQKLKNKHQVFLTTLESKKADHKAALEALDSLKSRLATASVWVEHASSSLANSSLQSESLKVQEMVRQKEQEMHALFGDCQSLESRVAAKDLQMCPSVSDQLDLLKDQWQRLTRECHQMRLQREHQQHTASLYSKIEKKNKRKKPEEAVVVSHQQQLQNAMSNGDDVSRSSPQIYACLRDHRDLVRRRRGQLAALRLAGDAKGVQRQVEQHEELR